MKRILSCIIGALYMLSIGAYAFEMTEGEYTDVTSVMTQDSVLDLEVFTDEPEEECYIVLQQPDETSMALLEDVYDFVWRQKHRPVRYYDEETQKKIQALVPEVDIDILHLTEFMGQEMYGIPKEDEDVVVERLLDVEYYPGQLVVVVLGYLEENEEGVEEYRWFPYRAEVPEMGLIRYTIPKEDYDLFVGQPQIIYHVLTDRIGARGDVLENSEIVTERIERPSKTADDIVRIRRWYTSTGEVIEDDFRIFLVDKTKKMNEEIERIGKFLEEENPVINWFPEYIVDEAQLLLGPAVDREKLLAYDIVAVMSENYKDTYGDVATENTFASVYDPEHRMVVMLGFPLDEDELPDLPPEELEKVTHFEWYCLRTEALEVEDVVEIVFKQLIIPRMEEEPALLIVLSEPLHEPSASQLAEMAEDEEDEKE